MSHELRMLRPALLDAPAIHEIIVSVLIDRLVQEEVWAQTLWPEGETCLTEHIVANLGGYREHVLETARALLGVHRMGWES